jgi:hypothetical protein
MLKLQTTALATVAVAGLVFAAGQANAQSESLIDEPITLQVLNNFTFARTTAMNFGTYVVNADTANGGNTATLTMNPTTGAVVAANNGDAQFISVSSTGRSRGVYAVSSAAPSTTLTVSTSNLGNLACGGCTGSPPVLTLTSVTPDASSPVTDSNGAVTINFGAVLTTIAGGNQYTDGTYAGDFDILVSY